MLALTSDEGRDEFCLLFFMAVEVIVSPAHVGRQIIVCYFALHPGYSGQLAAGQSAARIETREGRGGRVISLRYGVRLMSRQSIVKHLFEIRARLPIIDHEGVVSS